ncbi:hypothetical protein [Haladaptatus sp. NG-WS-4]
MRESGASSSLLAAGPVVLLGLVAGIASEILSAERSLNDPARPPESDRWGVESLASDVQFLGPLLRS